MDDSTINNYVKRSNKKIKKDIVQITPSKSEKTIDSNLDNIINSLLIKHMSEQMSVEKELNKEYKKDLNTLAPILSEFLDNYILIGHDVLGNEVMYYFAKSQNDKNAVYKLFMDTFMRIMSQNNNGNF